MLGRVYSILANNTDNSVNEDYYGKIANNEDIPSKLIQKYLLVTIDFAKGMRDDINLYNNRRDKLNNASFQAETIPYCQKCFPQTKPT